MSSFPNHSTHTFLLAKLSGLSLIPAIVCGLLAILPDVHPIPETSKGNWDDLYARYHNWHGWKRDWWKVVILPIGFHVLVVDRFTHKKNGGWNVVGWVTEFIWWGFFIWLVFS